jgi:hypothetical protein
MATKCKPVLGALAEEKTGKAPKASTRRVTTTGAMGCTEGHTVDGKEE